jgi:hypothetical protein
MEVCISTEMNAPSASHLGMVDCGFKTDQSTIGPGKRLSSIPIQFHLPDLSCRLRRSMQHPLVC